MNNTATPALELRSNEHEDVGATRIDNYRKENEINTIDLVKIDIEGHELSVFKDMSSLLSEKKAANPFIEINSQPLQATGTSIDSAVSFLEKFGGTRYSIDIIATKKNEGRDESLMCFTHAPN